MRGGARSGRTSWRTIIKPTLCASYCTSSQNMLDIRGWHNGSRERALRILISSLTRTRRLGGARVMDIEFHEADRSGNIDVPLCGVSREKHASLIDVAVGNLRALITSIVYSSRGGKKTPQYAFHCFFLFEPIIKKLNSMKEERKL